MNCDVPQVPVAVIGCGYWGKNLVRNFAELGVLAAICDPDQATAAKLSERFDAPVRSLDHVLADPSIAAVAIAAPAVHHASLAHAALEAGKHVFVEKPLALDARRGRASLPLRGAAQSLSDGRSSAAIPSGVYRLARCGAPGRARAAAIPVFESAQSREGSAEEDILWSFAPHDLSMILSLVGQEPVEVTATGASYLHKTIADVTTTHLAFPGGEQAHVFVSWLHPFKEQKLVAVGDRAMAVFDDGQPWSKKLLVYPHRIDWRETMPVPQRAEAMAIELEEGEPLEFECRHFLECVATGTRPRTDGQEGLRVLRVLTRASESLKAPPLRKPSRYRPPSRGCKFTPRPLSMSRARSAPERASGTLRIFCRAHVSVATARSARTSWSART